MTLTWALIISVLVVLLLFVIIFLVGFIGGIKWAHARLRAVSPHQPTTDRSVRQVFL
jgi:hypothetical protein